MERSTVQTAGVLGGVECKSPATDSQPGGEHTLLYFWTLPSLLSADPSYTQNLIIKNINSLVNLSTLDNRIC